MIIELSVGSNALKARSRFGRGNTGAKNATSGADPITLHPGHRMLREECSTQGAEQKGLGK